MSVRIEGRVYLLDKEDLAVVGAVLVRLVAEGTTVTPTMISTIPATRSIALTTMDWAHRPLTRCRGQGSRRRRTGRRSSHGLGSATEQPRRWSVYQVS